MIDMLKNQKLSFHPEKGFRAGMGYHIREGKKIARVWWLGKIGHNEAQFQANMIRQVFREMCRSSPFFVCKHGGLSAHATRLRTFLPIARHTRM